jgi:hypothetical protein
MGTKWQKLKSAHDRLFRLWLIGSIAGGAVAYALLIASEVVWACQITTGGGLPSAR